MPKRIAKAAVEIAPHCGTCRHWVTTAEHARGWGECRRFPPSVQGVSSDGDVVSVYAMLPRMSEACGEYKPTGEH